MGSKNIAFIVDKLITLFLSPFFKLVRYNHLKYISMIEIVKEINLFRVIARLQAKNKVKIRVYKLNGQCNKQFNQIRIDKTTIIWPKSANLQKLKDVYVEVFYPKNGHYYEAFGALVQKGDVIFDIGSSEGFFAKKHCSVASKIYLFEPSKLCAACLRESFRGSKNIIIVNKALGDGNRMVYFSENEDPALGALSLRKEESSYSIEMVSIDAFVRAGNINLKNRGFIKMDVEGAEIDILKGAQRTITEVRPRMSITTYHKANHAQQIIRFVTSLRPDYQFRVKGIVTYNGVPRPVMVHFW